LSPDLIAAMRDSTDDIVRLIFSIPIASNGRLVQQDQTTSSNNKTDTQQYSQSRSQQTMSTYFRYSLMSLLRTTLDGTPHFVRCIRPNTLQKADHLCADHLIRQLRYSGLLETVRARASGFTHRLSFADFLRRYCFLGFSFDERVVATKENCQLLLLR
jgi:myosin-3